MKSNQDAMKKRGVASVYLDGRLVSNTAAGIIMQVAWTWSARATASYFGKACARSIGRVTRWARSSIASS